MTAQATSPSLMKNENFGWMMVAVGGISAASSLIYIVAVGDRWPVATFLLGWIVLFFGKSIVKVVSNEKLYDEQRRRTQEAKGKERADAVRNEAEGPTKPA